MEGSGLGIGQRRDGRDGVVPGTNIQGGACCAQEKGEAEDVEDAVLDLPRERFRRIGADLGSQPRQVDAEKDMVADREAGNYASGTGTPESDSGPKPEMSPAPDSPFSSAQLPLPRVQSDKHPHLESSFDKTCEPSQAPRADGAQYDEMTCGVVV